jgi:hypothetical protein
MSRRAKDRNRITAVTLRFIAHVCQRYPTVGDWFWRYTTLHIRVSDMNDDKYNMLVAVHEYVEALLCLKAEVDEKAVDAFDIKFEQDRAKGLHGPDDEPGDDPSAPYYEQHQTATRVEKFLAKELGVDWEKYDATVNSL